MDYECKLIKKLKIAMLVSQQPFQEQRCPYNIICLRSSEHGDEGASYLWLNQQKALALLLYREFFFYRGVFSNVCV